MPVAKDSKGILTFYSGYGDTVFITPALDQPATSVSVFITETATPREIGCLVDGIFDHDRLLRDKTVRLDFCNPESVQVFIDRLESVKHQMLLARRLKASIDE